jgi:hypothetical protein
MQIQHFIENRVRDTHSALKNKETDKDLEGSGFDLLKGNIMIFVEETSGNDKQSQ